MGTKEVRLSKLVVQAEPSLVQPNGSILKSTERSVVLPVAAKAIPAAAKVDNPWEWRWHGRTIAVEQVILNSESHKPVQEWVKANTLVLKVKLDPSEQLTGVGGNFVYNGEPDQEAAKIIIKPGNEQGTFMVSISGKAPGEERKKVAFALKEMLVNNLQNTTFKVDWKKYRAATTDGDGRTLISLAEQQPHKLYDGELRLTHLYYGNSTLYLTVENDPELKPPYGLPVAVDSTGLVVTNEKGEVSPSITVTSGVPVTEGITATTIELGRNNFTDGTAMLNVQVAKLSAKLVIDENVPIK
jgi:hypothetical protein